MKRCQMCLDMARPEPIVAIDCRIAKALLQRNSVPSYTEVAQRICDLADKMRIAMTTQIRFTAETQRRMFNHSFRMQFDSPQRRRERGEEHASLLAPLRTLRLCGEYQTVKCDSPQRRRERGVGIRSSSQPTGSTNNPPAGGAGGGVPLRGGVGVGGGRGRPPARAPGGGGGGGGPPPPPRGDCW
jgi:hypothetical protein